jgi:hypothetical protein
MTVTEILFKVALTLSTIKQTKPSIYDPFDIFKHFFFFRTKYIWSKFGGGVTNNV